MRKGIYHLVKQIVVLFYYLMCNLCPVKQNRIVFDSSLGKSQLFEIVGHLSAESFNQIPRHFLDKSCFVFVKSAGIYKFFKLFVGQICHFLRRIRFGEQQRRHLIDSFVGALCRQNHSHQQLILIFEYEFAFGRRKFFRKYIENFFGFLFHTTIIYQSVVFNKRF